MAASLAAIIKDKLGITAKLKKGHGGIFEVAMDGKVLYWRAPCCPSPSATEIIERAEVFIKTRNVSDDAQQSDEADSCCDPSSHGSCCC